MKIPELRTIIISRTDSIGDVVLTLPVAGILKKEFPGARIVFLGREYTRDIVNCSENVDEFIDWEELKDKSISSKVKFFKNLKADAILHIFPDREITKVAKLAGIAVRIGTISRIYNWTTCNLLPLVFRKNSDLHEAQLNAMLLKPIVAKSHFTLDELVGFYGLTKISGNQKHTGLPDKSRLNIILHPKSRGSGREWGDHNFSHLIDILDDRKFKIFICGTESEGDLIRDTLLNRHQGKITDLTGKLTLKEYIHFIHSSDALIACSTGPLHIAASAGINALGIYPPIRPVHPGRWKALGRKVKIFVLDKNCNKCRNSSYCECMDSIRPEQVLAYLNILFEQHSFVKPSLKQL